ncbi:MAG TPA: hypothetical protein VM820_01625 [Vicinamibacterales bacterium]|nr:hypothetical protein [Vicinamibacterales bacterium]
MGPGTAPVPPFATLLPPVPPALEPPGAAPALLVPPAAAPAVAEPAAPPDATPALAPFAAGGAPSSRVSIAQLATMGRQAKKPHRRGARKTMDTLLRFERRNVDRTGNWRGV